MYSLLISLLLLFNQSSSAGDLNLKCHQFMKEMSLIREGEEIDFPDLKMSTKWQLSQVIKYKNFDLLIMRLVTSLRDGSKESSREFEVLVQHTGKPEIKTFQEMISVPKKVIAKVGDAANNNDPSYYYIELTGDATIAATKSIVAGIPYEGFSGIVLPGGKASFDPTKGRIWKVVDASFDLRRGSTTEVQDIQAWQLDQDFKTYFSGAAKKRSSGGIEGADVAPWSQAFILKIID